MKTYRGSVLRVSSNHKSISSMKVLRRRGNKKTLKIINEGKDAKNKKEHEEPLVTYNSVVKEPSYFNLFKCGKNLLSRLDAACEKACMETSRYKYYT